VIPHGVLQPSRGFWTKGLSGFKSRRFPAKFGTLLMVFTIFFIFVGVICGFNHSTESLGRVFRQIFVPVTKSEFWLPPCPLCWLARASLVVFIGLSVAAYWS
jgi:disulfide bond formation protein DsbB